MCFYFMLFYFYLNNFTVITPTPTLGLKVGILGSIMPYQGVYIRFFSTSPTSAFLNILLIYSSQFSTI